MLQARRKPWVRLSTAHLNALSTCDPVPRSNHQHLSAQGVRSCAAAGLSNHHLGRHHRLRRCRHHRRRPCPRPRRRLSCRHRLATAPPWPHAAAHLATSAALTALTALTTADLAAALAAATPVAGSAAAFAAASLAATLCAEPRWPPLGPPFAFEQPCPRPGRKCPSASGPQAPLCPPLAMLRMMWTGAGLWACEWHRKEPSQGLAAPRGSHPRVKPLGCSLIQLILVFEHSISSISTC